MKHTFSVSDVGGASCGLGGSLAMIAELFQRLPTERSNASRSTATLNQKCGARLLCFTVMRTSRAQSSVNAYMQVPDIGVTSSKFSEVATKYTKQVASMGVFLWL